MEVSKTQTKADSPPISSATEAYSVRGGDHALLRVYFYFPARAEAVEMSPALTICGDSASKQRDRYG